MGGLCGPGCSDCLYLQAVWPSAGAAAEGRGSCADWPSADLDGDGKSRSCFSTSARVSSSSPSSKEASCTMLSCSISSYSAMLKSSFSAVLPLVRSGRMIFSPANMLRSDGGICCTGWWLGARRCPPSARHEGKHVPARLVGCHEMESDLLCELPCWLGRAFPSVHHLPNCDCDCDCCDRASICCRCSLQDPPLLVL